MPAVRYDGAIGGYQSLMVTLPNTDTQTSLRKLATPEVSIDALRKAQRAAKMHATPLLLNSPQTVQRTATPRALAFRPAGSASFALPAGQGELYEASLVPGSGRRRSRRSEQQHARRLEIKR
jgi:hypothetical protein